MMHATRTATAANEQHTSCYDGGKRGPSHNAERTATVGEVDGQDREHVGGSADGGDECQMSQ